MYAAQAAGGGGMVGAKSMATVADNAEVNVDIGEANLSRKFVIERTKHFVQHAEHPRSKLNGSVSSRTSSDNPWLPVARPSGWYSYSSSRFKKKMVLLNVSFAYY